MVRALALSGAARLDGGAGDLGDADALVSRPVCARVGGGRVRCPGGRGGGQAVGLFADQEIRLLQGPLFVGEPYEIEREIVFIGGSKRTESLWIKTTAFHPGSDTPLATMLLNAATFKDSYAPYAAEHQALYGAT